MAKFIDYYNLAFSCRINPHDCYLFNFPQTPASHLTFSRTLTNSKLKKYKSFMRLNLCNNKLLLFMSEDKVGLLGDNNDAKYISIG